MAEGGLLPWKIQKYDPPIPMSEFVKPLPPPPAGSHWERTDNGEWVLVKEKQDEEIVYIPPAASTNADEPTIIDHWVLPGENLRGICLRYNVKAPLLRQLNHFSGDNIRGIEVLRIPVRGYDGTGRTIPEQDPKAVALQRFKSKSHLPTTESRFYLEENNWELEAALKNWQEDVTFEEENAQEFVPSEPLFDAEEQEAAFTPQTRIVTTTARTATTGTTTRAATMSDSIMGRLRRLTSWRTSSTSSPRQQQQQQQANRNNRAGNVTTAHAAIAINGVEMGRPHLVVPPAQEIVVVAPAQVVVAAPVSVIAR